MISPDYGLHAIRNFVLTSRRQDRGQIGNARVMGLQKDLRINNDQYFNALLVFCMSHCFPNASSPSLLTKV